MYLSALLLFGTGCVFLYISGMYEELDDDIRTRTFYVFVACLIFEEILK